MRKRALTQWLDDVTGKRAAYIARHVLPAILFTDALKRVVKKHESDIKTALVKQGYRSPVADAQIRLFKKVILQLSKDELRNEVSEITDFVKMLQEGKPDFRDAMYFKSCVLLSIQNEHAEMLDVSQSEYDKMVQGAYTHHKKTYFKQK